MVVNEEEKADAVFSYFNDVLGTHELRSLVLNLNSLAILSLDLTYLDLLF